MKEGLAASIDKYLRRRDTILARSIRAISPEEGLEYRTSRRKDILERTIVTAAIIPTSPLVATLAIAARVEDGGSSFYKSKRIGRHGEVFDLIKIRSLHGGADKDPIMNDANVKNRWNTYDPRSTKIGAWMRKWRLDELPQLWQVATGKLSLFGIRAMHDLTLQAIREERPQEAQQLFEDYFASKPAAINPMTAFNHGDANPNKRYHYNAFYARKASLGMDLYMCFRTLIRPFLDKDKLNTKKMFTVARKA